jgi:hypothetical protein
MAELAVVERDGSDDVGLFVGRRHQGVGERPARERQERKDENDEEYAPRVHPQADPSNIASACVHGPTLPLRTAVSRCPRAIDRTFDPDAPAPAGDTFGRKGVRMTQTGHALVVNITRQQPRRWLTSIEKGVRPERHAPERDVRHDHVREAQHHHGHGTNQGSPVFYDSVADAEATASEIILVGPGTGKADVMSHLARYRERKHPDVARKLIGAVNADLEALSENQVPALVRDWWREHREFVSWADPIQP